MCSICHTRLHEISKIRPCLRVPANPRNSVIKSGGRETFLGGVGSFSFFHPFLFTQTPSSLRSSIKSPGRFGSEATQNPFLLSCRVPHRSHLPFSNQCHSQFWQYGTQRRAADPMTSPILKSPIVVVFKIR